MDISCIKFPPHVSLHVFHPCLDFSHFLLQFHSCNKYASTSSPRWHLLFLHEHTYYVCSNTKNDSMNHQLQPTIKNFIILCHQLTFRLLIWPWINTTGAQIVFSYYVELHSIIDNFARKHHYNGVALVLARGG
jgi:hypothetical protein